MKNDLQVSIFSPRTYANVWESTRAASRCSVCRRVEKPNRNDMCCRCCTCSSCYCSNHLCRLRVQSTIYLWLMHIRAFVVDALEQPILCGTLHTASQLRSISMANKHCRITADKQIVSTSSERGEKRTVCAHAYHFVNLRKRAIYILFANNRRITVVSTPTHGQRKETLQSTRARTLAHPP